MAQPAQIERCNKRMADSLSNGHGSPRSIWSASCSPYCSLGTRWKESQTGCPAFLSKFIVIGTYKELTLKEFYENTTWQEDYTHITLTDEEDIPDAIGKLRTVYHRLMKLDYDNKRTRSSMEIRGATDVESKSPLELFSDFYELQNNQSMNPEQFEYMKSLIEKTWEGEQ